MSISNSTTSAEYRPIKDFPMYRVGDDGSVWSRWSGIWKRLRPGTDTDGYPQVTLCDGARRKTAKVHALVLESFVGLCPEGMEARHLNGKRNDARRSNLQWAVHRVNIADKVRHGTMPRGSGHHNAKLTEDDIPPILTMLRDGVPFSVIAARFGVTETPISLIAQNKTWTHIKREVIVRKRYTFTNDDVRKSAAIRGAAKRRRAADKD